VVKILNGIAEVVCVWDILTAGVDSVVGIKSCLKKPIQYSGLVLFRPRLFSLMNRSYKRPWCCLAILVYCLKRWRGHIEEAGQKANKEVLKWVEVWNVC
jgi:hypothetical protein